MPLLGFDLPVQAIDALFDEYDPDGSGVMDFKELQKMLRPAPKPAGAASKMGGLKGKWGKAKDAAVATTTAGAAVEAFNKAGQAPPGVEVSSPSP